MDANSSQPVQQNKLPKWLTTVTPFSKVLAMILFILFPFLGFYLGMLYQQQFNFTITSALDTGSRTITKNVVILTPTVTPLPIQPDLATYSNPAGFSLVYGKTNNIDYPSCSDEEKGISGTVSLKIFEDPSANTIYIGNETELIAKFKTLPDGTETLDYSTCQAVPNSLDLIKNGYPNGSKSLDKLTYSNALKYQYKKIYSDTDLTSFAQSVFGNGCSTINKTLVPSQTDVYSITVSDKNGSSDVNSGCWTDYGYGFVYSTKYNVAVVGPVIQNCPYSYTPNNHCEAQITFP